MTDTTIQLTALEVADLTANLTAAADLNAEIVVGRNLNTSASAEPAADRIIAGWVTVADDIVRQSYLNGHATTTPIDPVLRAYTAEPEPAEEEEELEPEPEPPQPSPEPDHAVASDDLMVGTAETTLSGLSLVSGIFAQYRYGDDNNIVVDNRINLQEYYEPEPEPPAPEAIRISHFGATSWSTGTHGFTNFGFSGFRSVSLEPLEPLEPAEPAEPAKPVPAPKLILKPIRKTRRVLNLAEEGWVVK